LVAAQRAWYRHFPRQRSVNLVVSNAPGPPVPLYLAGARLLELFPMMPTMGNLTLVVAAVSYAGQLNLTAVADRDRCPDLEVFTQGVGSALDDLTRAGGLVTVETRATSAASVGAASPAQERRSHVGSAQS
jgi:diacylglycerol O-acyltransferase